MTLGVDFFFAAADVFADGADLFAVDGYVGLLRRASAAIDDRSVLDDYVMSHNWVSSIRFLRIISYPTEGELLSTAKKRFGV